MIIRTLILASAITLGGCAGLTGGTTTALNDAQTALTAANAALTTYGIAKGLALVAEVADPALAAPLNLAIAAADPQVAKLQAAVNAGQLDLTTITALIAAINASAQLIQIQAAPAIKVVPSK